MYPIDADVSALVAVSGKLAAIAKECREIGDAPRSRLARQAAHAIAAQAEGMVMDCMASIAGLKCVAESERAARG